MIEWFLLFGGFLAGALFTFGFSGLQKTDGRFIIDETDQNKTVWRLDVDFDPEEVKTRKRLRFKVYIQKED